MYVGRYKQYEWPIVEDMAGTGITTTGGETDAGENTQGGSQDGVSGGVPEA